MLRFIALSLSYMLMPFLSQAETLTVEKWRGHNALRISGTIVSGSAQRFYDAVKMVEKFPHGLPVLLLDSSGGSVSEAMEMSRLMDATPFHTVVPNGAECASACASILFIAGTYRTVENNGKFGQHSCSISGVSNEDCNEELAQHAMSHGVSHGSVAAFVNYVPPNEILWLSREDVDGWGLSRYAGGQESGFKKSEPRVFKRITGKTPSAQAAWRLDFREDAFKAFLRPVSDAERELQLNIFCNENLKGRLFLSMDINGPASVIMEAVKEVQVKTDLFDWSGSRPIIWQAEPTVSEIITEVPKEFIIPLLSKAVNLKVMISMKSPYNPIFAQTSLKSSREVLLFAANNCASGNFSGASAPLQ